MSYNEELEIKIDRLLAEGEKVDKKKMFGGICYLVRGNMCFGIWKDYLIVRAGVQAAEEKLRKDNVRPFDITGRAMKGWVMVARERWTEGEDLKEWLAVGRDFALTLPEK